MWLENISAIARDAEISAISATCGRTGWGLAASNGAEETANQMQSFSVVLCLSKSHLAEQWQANPPLVTSY